MMKGLSWLDHIVPTEAINLFLLYSARKEHFPNQRKLLSQRCALKACECSAGTHLSLGSVHLKGEPWVIWHRSERVFFATCHTMESESVWKKRISALLGEEASWSLNKTPNIKSHYAVLTPYCRSSTSKGYSTCQINLLYTNFYIQHKRKQICKTQLNPPKSQEPLLPDHEQEVIQRCQQDLYRYGWFTQTIGCTATEQSCSVTFLSSQPSVRTRLMPRSLLVS